MGGIKVYYDFCAVDKQRNEGKGKVDKDDRRLGAPAVMRDDEGFQLDLFYKRVHP